MSDTSLQQLNLASHEIIELQTAYAYRPYDHLVLRNVEGRAIWTVLRCEPAGHAWKITAIRCQQDCRAHHRKR